MYLSNVFRTCIFTIDRSVSILFLFILCISFSYSENISLGGISISFSLPTGFHQGDPEDQTSQTFETKPGNDGGYYSLDFLLLGNEGLREEPPITTSKYLQELLRRVDRPTVTDLNELLKKSNGPVLFSRTNDYVYAGFKRIKVSNIWQGESVFSCSLGDRNKIYGPFLFYNYINTPNGILFISLIYFQEISADKMEGLRAYGEIEENYLKFVSQNQFEKIYDDMSKGARSIPNDLLILYGMNEKILNSLVITETKK